jgi:regulator of protease activity HflC (stomatin/prohibitin superfamily)
MAIPGQEVVTSDGFSIKLSLAVRQKVVDPVVAMTQVEDYHGTVYSIVQVALREVVGSMAIDDLLQRRNEVGPAGLGRSAEPAGAIGMELVSVDVKDLMFPGPLKRTFAQVIEARQQGLAALEKARGETAALRNLANAARLVESNPSLLQLRLVQQLEASSGNTLVVGFPSNSTPLPVKSEGATRPPEISAGSGPTDVPDEP